MSDHLNRFLAGIASHSKQTLNSAEFGELLAQLKHAESENVRDTVNMAEIRSLPLGDASADDDA